MASFGNYFIFSIIFVVVVDLGLVKLPTLIRIIYQKMIFLIIKFDPLCSCLFDFFFLQFCYEL